MALSIPDIESLFARRRGGERYGGEPATQSEAGRATSPPAHCLERARRCSL